MERPMRRLLTLALLLAVPLTLCTRIEDVFFGAWRAAQWAYLAPMLILVGGRWISGAADPRLSNATAPWALLAVWTLAGALWSVNPADGLRRALELSGAIAAVWLGIAVSARPGRWLAGAVAAAALCSVYGVLQFFGIDPLPWSTTFGARAFGTLGNPDYYAGHLLLIFPCSRCYPLPSCSCPCRS